MKKLLDPEQGYCSLVSHTAGLTASVQTDVKETREAIENRKGARVKYFVGCQSQQGSSIWWVLHLAESEKCEPVLTWSSGVPKMPPRITHFAVVLTVQEKTTKLNSIEKAKGQNKERGSL